MKPAILVLLVFGCVSTGASGSGQTPGPSPLSEIAALTSVRGVCTGVRFRSAFVLTAEHCVPAPGNFLTVKLHNGTAKSTKILAKNSTLKLAVVCAPDVGGSIDIAASAVKDKQTVSVVDEGAIVSGRVFNSAGVQFGVDPNGGSLCSGDSGGPALQGLRVHGVLDQAHCSVSGSGFYYLTTSPAARSFLNNATNETNRKECTAGY